MLPEMRERERGCAEREDYDERDMNMLQRFGICTAMLCALVGCHGSGNSNKTKTEQYAVRGTVVSVDVARGMVSLSAETIPNFMEAMTMDYPLEDKAAATELHPGDRITATLECERDSAGPMNLRLRDVVIIAQARPDYKPAMQYHVPAEGETVPDFKLLNQSGKTINLKQFRGKVVALTFIYTRCPVVDYCPRMSRNFAEVDKALAAEPTLYAKTHLLSISFDPAYDTPKVLRSYGEAYTGKYTQETFAHWDFAAPDAKELQKVEEWFDLGVTPGDGGSLTHSLATVVVGKDGKVLAYYPTNEWTPAEVLAKMRAGTA
jgi:protein SCO1/2